jgi:putative restriction endonuclease
MKLFVGITDNQWFDYLRRLSARPPEPLDEVNFWQPSPDSQFRAIRPRLGQDAFKVAVTDAYQRSCAITEEQSLPALEAAHIKPYGESGPHAVHNGLLLRSDVHRLFDSSYITVTPDYRIEVSRRLKEEFENGRYYYPFHGNRLHHLPSNAADHPAKDLLTWHNENIFKG